MRTDLRAHIARHASLATFSAETCGPLPRRCADKGARRLQCMQVGMNMAQHMQGMMGALTPQQAMAMAQGMQGMPGMSMGMGQTAPMMGAMGAMGGVPAVGGMARPPQPPTPPGAGGGGGGGGKYNMVAPPSNLMMEHKKLMNENQVDGQGMQVLADAPQENRHGADYFQRDDRDGYDR